MTLLGRLVITIVCAPLVSCALTIVDPELPAHFREDMTLRDHAGVEYDAILSMPHGEPIALAVLFGGGSVTDPHWTVPATVVIENQTVALTTGAPTRGADAIADALLRRGIAVYQFSSIPRASLGPGVNPGMVPGVPYAESRAIACAALTQALAVEQTFALPVVCIGHSLGSARMLQCVPTDPRIGGFVALSGAYLSNLRGPVAAVEQPLVETLRAQGADLDAGVPVHRWREAAAIMPDLLRPISTGKINLDRDGVVRRWEAAGALHRAMLDAGDRTFERDSRDLVGQSLPGDVLVARGLPTLVIYGGLDPMAYHGRMLAAAAEHAGDASWLTVEYRHDLGHNLSPVAPRSDGFEALAGPTLVGPIDFAVCERIADFVAEVARR